MEKFVKQIFWNSFLFKRSHIQTILFDIQPELFLEDDNIDNVVMYLLNNHQRDLLEAMKNVSTK